MSSELAMLQKELEDMAQAMSDRFGFPGGVASIVVAEAIARVMAREIVRAQHEETGRLWEGPRGELPPRYSEIRAALEVGETNVRD